MSSTPAEPAMPNAAPAPRLGRWAFVALNVWLCYHLFAIVVGPASVPPAPPIAQDAWRFASGYLQAFYLNHGFHYFSPDPAGSTLVAYTLEMPDGSMKSGRLPHRKIWPRLLYHRHFMVTEFLGNGPEEFRPFVQRALARQLLRDSGAQAVRLELLYHDTAGVQEILSGQTLNEPASFHATDLGRYTPSSLESPFEPSIDLPAPAEMLEETPSVNAVVEEDLPSATVRSEGP